jgi:hypothetical protein
MNTRKTVALALLLGVAVLYLTKVLLPSRAREEGGRLAFSGVQPEEISQIDVARRSLEGSVEQYTLVQSVVADAKKEGGVSVDKQKPTKSTWSLPAIRGAVLDTNVMGEFVKTIKDLPVENPLSDRELHTDLSVYGLDKPVLTIVVHKGAYQSTEVAFGKKNEYLSKRYTKISGRSGVFLVPEVLFSSINKGRSDVRSKYPVQFSVTDVREALLTSSQGRIKVAQPAVGQWKIVEPSDLPASTDAVDALLNTLNGVTVTEFIEAKPEELGKYGFGTPRVNIHLHMREGLEPNQIAFSLANAAAKTGGPDEMYLQVSGVDSIYKLASDPSPSLVKRVNDLREKAIVGLTTANIESVTSAGSGISPTTIASSGLLWTVNGQDGDPMFVEQYLKDLAALKADDFPEGVPADAFDSPYLQLTVTTKGADKQTLTVTVGKEVAGATGDSLRYVKNSRSDTAYAIRDVEAKRLVPHEEALAAKATPTPVSTVVPDGKKG